jgi:hypothetical protein
VKKQLPAIPHTVSYATRNWPDGRFSELVMIVGFLIPSRVAAHLVEREGGIVIPCAGIGDIEHIPHRVRQWNRSFQDHPPGREYLQAAAAEGCNTSVRVHCSPAEWHLIGYLCGRLRITPGQWFVAGAARNAKVSEAEIEEALMALTTPHD